MGRCICYIKRRHKVYRGISCQEPSSAFPWQLRAWRARAALACSAMVKGGLRQRMARAKASSGKGSGFTDPGAALAGSHLVAVILAKMAWGEMSAPVAQQVAAAAVKDGLENPQVKKMAAAGNSGMYPWNCARVIEAMWPNMILRAGLQMVDILMPKVLAARPQ